MLNKRGMIVKKVLGTIAIAACFILTVSLFASAQEEKVVNDKSLQALDSNYKITLTIETSQIKKDISFIIGSNDFEFGQYFSMAQVNFQGNLKVQKDSTLFLSYNLGIRGNIANKSSIKSTWIDSGCRGGVLLQEGNDLTIFKAENSVYTINISKIK
jgi:hypothetical protein